MYECMYVCMYVCMSPCEIGPWCVHVSIGVDWISGVALPSSCDALNPLES